MKRLRISGAEGPSRAVGVGTLPRAFTLIELVISVAIGALVLGSAYLCLNAGFAAQRLIEPRADAFQNARVALELICADLRGACAFASGPEFVGFHRKLGEVDADNLDFATRNHTPRGVGQGDYCEQSLYLEKNPRTGEFSLLRRRNPRTGFDPLSGGSREEIATGLKGFRLEYYDGFEWYDTWGEMKSSRPAPGATTSIAKAAPASASASAASSLLPPNASGLPEAVRVTLRFQPASRKSDAAEAPLVFQSIARIAVPTRARTSTTTTDSNAGPAPVGGPPPTP